MSKRKTITCGIYKIVSPKGKVYIGQSVCIEERHNRYKNGKCSHQSKVYSSIIKYGWDNHIFSVLHKCPKEELNFWEKLYIAMFDSTGEYGLNIKSGGQESKVTEESRKKMSDAHKGQIVWNKGKRGLQKAWNKGTIGAVTTKSYTFIKEGKILVIENLKQYCIDNNLVYHTMMNIGNYGYQTKYYKKNYYKGYSKPTE